MDEGEIPTAVAKYVVTIAEALYHHASSCLRNSDGYGVEVTYVLLGYIQDMYQGWFKLKQGRGYH